jgi:hypothetical protein
MVKIPLKESVVIKRGKKPADLKDQCIENFQCTGLWFAGFWVAKCRFFCFLSPTLLDNTNVGLSATCQRDDICECLAPDNDSAEI